MKRAIGPPETTILVQEIRKILNEPIKHLTVTHLSTFNPSYKQFRRILSRFLDYSVCLPVGFVQVETGEFVDQICPKVELFDPLFSIEGILTFSNNKRPRFGGKNSNRDRKDVEVNFE